MSSTCISSSLASSAYDSCLLPHKSRSHAICYIILIPGSYISLLSFELWTAGRDIGGSVWVEDSFRACSCTSTKCCSCYGTQWHFPEWHWWFYWRVSPSMLVALTAICRTFVFTSSMLHMRLTAMSKWNCSFSLFIVRA